MAETGDISGAGVAGTATGNSGGNSVLNLTNREQEILSKAIMCLKSPPDVDYVKLAEACGMTNHRSASNAWSAIKKKLTEHGALPAGTMTPKKTPVKRKVEPKDEGSDDDGDTPTKKPARKQATPKKPKAATAATAAAGPKKGRGKAVKKEAPAAKEEDSDDGGLADIPEKGSSPMSEDGGEI